METETFWQNKVYNFRHSEWNWRPSEGEAVMFEPFRALRPVYAECVEIYGHYAIIDVPKGTHQWFTGPAGEYIVPERLLFPQ